MSAPDPSYSHRPLTTNEACSSPSPHHMSALSLPSNSAHVLNIPQTMPSTARQPAPAPPSPPRAASINPSSPSAATQEKPSVDSTSSAESKSKHEVRDHTVTSPPPPPKLPEVPVSPNNLAASPSSASVQAPAQLAFMLSNALADVDALKKSLSDEKRRADRAERLLHSFHPNLTLENGIPDEQKKEPLSEGALKAVLDAEARAERAERARDDALHALHSLTTHFAELERYESSLSLRASDARGAFTRLLTTITSSLPPPASSPTLSGSPLTLGLPPLPAPLPAPSVNATASQYLSGPGAPPLSSSSRYSRGLPSHAPPSLGYPSHGSSHTRQSSQTHASTFSGLPLPPPPSASGLGSGSVGSLAPPPSSLSSLSVPAKRSHRSRSTRGLDDGSESGTWDDPKRRRVGPWDMDVDEPHAGHVEQPLPYPQHQPPLSAQPTQRINERERDRLLPQQSYARNGAYPEINGNGTTNANGMVRVDARELVRDAKERERRERRLYHPRREGEASKRRRSASRSSAGSSWSIDEMLLETATDAGREKREDGRPSPVGALQDHVGSAHYPPHAYAQGASAPPSSQVREEPAKKTGSHSSQPSTGSVTGVNGPAPGEREKSGKVPASQLVTLGPGGVVVSGGGQAIAPLPGGGYPAYNEAGQRICRQCGVPGRYKDGKCVEKWGPGPEGPGTVCDRCRKKMKRVERRGTLDSAMAAAQHQAFLTHRQSQSQLQAQPTLPLAPSHAQPNNRTRAPTRTDTLLLDPHSQSQTQSTMRSSSQQYAYSREREKERDEGHRETSSRSHSPVPGYQASSVTRNGQASPQSQGQSQGRSQARGRAPTLPYITSISTREQARDEDAENERDGNEELDVDAEIARAAEVGNGSGSKSREASKSVAQFSSSSSLSSNVSLGASNGNVRPPRSSSRASSTSTATAYEQRETTKASRAAAKGTASSKHVPLPSVATLSRSGRRRDTLDELNEDDADADGDVDGSGDADPDTAIMDAVDATMKVEE